MFQSYFSTNMETSDLSIPLCNSMLLMVGSEDEINMKRTEMDCIRLSIQWDVVCANAQNNCWEHKRRIKVVSSRCGYILLFVKSPWCLGLHWCKNVRLNYCEGCSYGILRIHSWNGLSTFDKPASIKWCYKSIILYSTKLSIYISRKLFFENAESLYIGDCT